MFKVVGYQYSKGNYEGIDYDNIKLHTITDTDARITGMSCVIVKINRSMFGNVCNCTLDDLIGKNVSLDYQYVGNRPQLVRITVLGAKGND